MSSWILIAAGKSLFAAFDELAPDRDHASDGSIGDAAHAAETSDHNPDETGAVPIHDADHVNEVHAIDVDSDLRTSGLDMERVVQFILSRCRAGAETRLRYVIYARRIWEADNGWRQRAYTGASAHLEHAHFSFSYVTSLEASTVSWHLEEIDVAAGDLAKIEDMINTAVAGLTKTSPLTGPDGKPDGTISTAVGHFTLSQGSPDGTDPDGGRAPFYTVVQHLGIELARVGAAVDAIAAKLGDA